MKTVFLLLVSSLMASVITVSGQVRKIDTIMKLGNIGFKLVTNNKNEDKNYVTISPIGFGSGARDVSFEVKGRIRKAEIDDLNNEGSENLIIGNGSGNLVIYSEF